MTHWLKVREHHVKKIGRKSDRYKNRLQLLLKKTHPSSAADTAAEQPKNKQDNMDTS